MNNENTRVEEWRHHRRIIAYGFIAIIVLIGVAIISNIYLQLAYPGTVITPYPFRGFGFLWAIFGLFFLFWILRGIFWPWRSRYWYGWGHGYYRHWRDDDAVSILKARYARGEINKEQFDQLIRDIGSQS